ncbi:diguanylate cyclase [Pseudobacteroides cellulosolvens]|uniref:Diguanylate cyclase n=1 Tax=Pseudobacteroides cellulosolvens ATCC 35603 = DSM 2933 TaxID=398512 RepID=A0A0L6JRJ7_9FIRM|nr:diguanylate cyclase [Pseudobacteroides cellulosolvens]KNY28461.1 diguanylate cyclase [Pseudobacteroides cellulosolvens ATCC 35603 = DSM 2933]
MKNITPHANDNSISIKDPLTGAFNRSLMDERLLRELEWADKCGLSLSLCFIDVDYFKNINDIYGHAFGDNVLIKVVHSIEESIRKSDLLFRYGGDEFVVILINTNKEEACFVAEKMLFNVKSLKIREDCEINISLSIGVAAYPEDGLSPEEIIKNADNMCYEAKHRGRGQVVSIISNNIKEILLDKEASRLIERDDQIRKVRMFLSKLREEGRGVLSIIGSPGSGKTSFVKKIDEIAAMQNFEVITLNAARELKVKAYGVLLECDEVSFSDKISGTAGIERALKECVSTGKKDGLIIIVDDLAYLDHATLNLLRYLLLGKNNNMVIGVVYTSEVNSYVNFVNFDIPLFDIVNLNSISFAGVRIFIRSILLWEPSEEFLDWIYQKTKGLPKKLKELVTYLIENGMLNKKGEHEWILDDSYKNINDDNNSFLSFRIPPNNIPAEVNEFIGRGSELDEIKNMLETNRLITLLGPGGIGKSRLAIQVAYSELTSYEGGVYFVNLSSIVKSDLVLTAIAKVLKVIEKPGVDTIESIKEFLKGKHTLIILDNFEQLINVAYLVEELLTSEPAIHFVVTSRVVLDIDGEKVYNLEPMEIPELGKKLSLEQLAQNNSVALFIARAQAVQSDFVLSEDNVSRVAELCSRLEGIPLAIELAAANMGQLSLDEMIEQSRKRLKWLSGGMRDLPERHATLRKTIEWSYSLLNENERKFFVCLGLFSGEFTAEAVDKIVDREFIGVINIKDALVSISNKSLLKYLYIENDNEIYYTMLETIREYAEEMLKNSGIIDGIEKRYISYYLYLVENAEKEYSGPKQYLWLRKIEKSYLNIYAAMELSLVQKDVETEVRMAGALGSFWEIRGRLNEGKTCIEGILKRYGNSSDTINLVKVYRWAGRLLLLYGDRIGAEKSLNEGLELAIENGDKYEEASIIYAIGLMLYGANYESMQYYLWNISLGFFREIGNKAGIAQVLIELANIYYYSGNYIKSDKFSKEAYQLYKDMEDEIGMGRAIHKMGQVARSKGDFKKSEELFLEYYEICQKNDNRAGLMDSLISLAELARSQRQYDLAREYYVKNIEISREIGYQYMTAFSIKDLGEVARFQGNFDEAKKLYHESMVILDKIGYKGGQVWIYRNLAEIEMTLENYSEAYKLFLASIELYDKIKVTNNIFLFLSIGGLAGSIAELGDRIKAAKLFGITGYYIDDLCNIVAEDDMKDYKERLDKLKSTLNEATFKKAWDEGSSIPYNEHVEYAIIS